MTKTAVLRLLHCGIPGLPGMSGLSPESGNVAAPFPLEEWAASPLSPFASGSSGNQKENIPVWRETMPDGSLPLLECPWPHIPAPVYLAGTATSSLDVAHALACRQLLPEWGSVLVLRQTAGRGQLRRPWASPEGNLYAALRLPTAYPMNTEAAAPAAGSLVAAALTGLGYAVSLKWPNDILQVELEEHFSPCAEETAGACRRCTADAWRKVGGILLEERGGVLLAGIGLNVSDAPPAAALREGHALRAGRLRARQPNNGNTPSGTGEARGFTPVFPGWAQLAGAIFSCYFPKVIGAVSPWWPDLAQRHLAFRGCRVRLENALPEQETGTERFSCEGVIEGICASGALRLRTKSGVETFLGGSLVLLS